MGMIVPFPELHRARRVAPCAEPARVIILPVVRIERHDVTNHDVTNHDAPTNHEGDTTRGGSGGKRRRRASRS